MVNIPLLSEEPGRRTSSVEINFLKMIHLELDGRFPCPSLEDLWDFWRTALGEPRQQLGQKNGLTLTTFGWLWKEAHQRGAVLPLRPRYRVRSKRIMPERQEKSYLTLLRDNETTAERFRRELSWHTDVFKLRASHFAAYCIKLIKPSRSFLSSLFLYYSAIETVSASARVPRTSRIETRTREPQQ